MINVEGLIDTGFDGDIILPRNILGNEEPPNLDLPWRLPDDAVAHSPGYVGAVYLGDLPPESVVIAAYGSETLIGRTLVERFMMILDHGQQVIVEP